MEGGGKSNGNQDIPRPDNVVSFRRISDREMALINKVPFQTILVGVAHLLMNRITPLAERKREGRISAEERWQLRTLDAVYNTFSPEANPRYLFSLNAEDFNKNLRQELEFMSFLGYRSSQLTADGIQNSSREALRESSAEVGVEDKTTPVWLYDNATERVTESQLTEVTLNRYSVLQRRRSESGDMPTESDFLTRLMDKYPSLPSYAQVKKDYPPTDPLWQHILR